MAKSWPWDSQIAKKAPPIRVLMRKLEFTRVLCVSLYVILISICHLLCIHSCSPALKTVRKLELLNVVHLPNILRVMNLLWLLQIVF